MLAAQLCQSYYRDIKRAREFCIMTIEEDLGITQEMEVKKMHLLIDINN